MKKLRTFIKNTWKFRKELSEFKGYDYRFNYNMFFKSLEVTRDFLRSNKTFSACAMESAKDIDSFLEEVRHALDEEDEQNWKVAMKMLKNKSRNWWD